MSVASTLEPFLTCGGRVSSNELAALRLAGRVLESKKRTGEVKVIAIAEPQPTANAEAKRLIVKVWHPERWLSSATYNPYNRRFRRNAEHLRKLGIAAPRVRGFGRVGFGLSCFICYEALPGRSLRALKPEVDLRSAAGFLARLHDLGIDFRSLHMGNILETGPGQFALIDLTDCRFSRRPLAGKLRLRRLAYFCSHKMDAEFMAADNNWLELFNAYWQAADADLAPCSDHGKSIESFQQLLTAGKFGHGLQ
jgi:hypothetical protein